jgi:Ni,Fe-hydrogenase maturation factor
MGTIKPCSKIRKLILGIGNPLRGDDGVGERVVRRLEQLGLASDTCRLELAPQWLPELVLDFVEVKRMIVIDASVAHVSGELSLQRSKSLGLGSRFNRNSGNHQVPEGMMVTDPSVLDHRFSSHQWDLDCVLKMASDLGYSLPRVCVWTIGVQSFEHGDCLSPVVLQSVERLVQHLFKAHHVHD